MSLVKEHGCMYGWMNGTNSDNAVSIQTMATRTMVTQNMIAPKMVGWLVGWSEPGYSEHGYLTSDDRLVKEHVCMDGWMNGTNSDNTISIQTMATRTNGYSG